MSEHNLFNFYYQNISLKVFYLGQGHKSMDKMWFSRNGIFAKLLKVEKYMIRSSEKRKPGNICSIVAFAGSVREL
jgi:hypothetical protein